MRHNMVVFVGGQLQQIANQAVNYMAEGSNELLPFAKVYNLQPKDDGSGAVAVKCYVFNPLEDDSATVECKDESDISNTIVSVKDKIDNVFREQVTLERPSDSARMTLTIIVPEDVRDYIAFVDNIVNAATESRNSYGIDVIFISRRICKCILNISETKDCESTNAILGHFAKLKESNEAIRHLVVIDDCNSAGMSINFSEQSLSNMLGEYSLLTIERYLQIYPQSLDAVEGKPVTAFGASVLSFNTSYFVKYLRRKTLLKVINKEGIGCDDIDINEASYEAQNYLRAQKPKIDSFWDDQIKPFLLGGSTQEEIASKASSKLDEIVESMISDVDGYINDPNCTLPKKQAIMAQILNEDDEIMSGSLFSDNQLMLEDMTNEAIEFFVKEENRHRSSGQGEIALIDRPLDGDGKLINPLPIIKELRHNIKTSMDYIRDTDEFIANLSKQIEDVKQSDKKVVEGGFNYGGTIYHLTEFHDQPLKETYVPHTVTERQIDMRKGFTDVKSQGELGACTAFSLTSIMEYIVKTGSGNDIDLSELFLYYNTRLGDGTENLNTGTSIHDAIQALSKYGICLEEYMHYDPASLTEKPSEEAYADGKGRIVIEAKNVERKLDDIKSALSDGYPVAISLNITENFGDVNKGFVSTPTTDEIDNIKGSHAMVICGYSDKEKFFIVRNSWGKDFGDAGYCYIPYMYIGDTRLLNAAYIVTKTAIDSENVVIKASNKVSFNDADATIHIAILSNLLAEEQANLSQLKAKYASIIADYSYLIGRLKNGAVRDEIGKNTISINKNLISSLESEKKEVEKNRQESLNALRTESIKYSIYCAIATVICILLGYLFYDNLKFIGVLLITLVLMGLWLLLYFWWYPNGKNRIRVEHDDKLKALSSQAAELRKINNEVSLKAHIYGIMLNKFSDYQHQLRERYNKLRSFNSNLLEWRKNLQVKYESMTPDEHIPFVPVMENDKLDEYFVNYVDTLTDGVYLFPLLYEYELTDESLMGLKDRLRSKIDSILKENIKNFSIVSFLLTPELYPFLKAESISNRVSLMERRAIPFVKYMPALHNRGEASNTFFANLKTDEKERIVSELNTYCNSRPMIDVIANRMKLILIRTKNLSVDEVV